MYIQRKCRLTKIPYYFARVPGSKNVRRDIFGYDAARSNGCASANRQTRIDNRTAANPDAISQYNGFSRFQPGITLFRHQRMRCGIDLNTGTQKHVIAYGDFCAIEHHTVKIGIKVIADVDVIAVIAKKAAQSPHAGLAY